MARLFITQNTQQSMKPIAKYAYAGHTTPSSAFQRIQLMEAGLTGRNGVNVTRVAEEVTDPEQEAALTLSQAVEDAPARETITNFAVAMNKTVNQLVVQMNNTTLNHTVNPLVNAYPVLLITVQQELL